MKRGVKIKSRVSISKKFLFLFAALFMVATVIGVAFSVCYQQDKTEKELLEKARVLNAELEANWNFINLNENRINTDAGGEYEFKGIYCVVAAKSSAKFLEKNTGYKVRYTDFEVRNSYDEADSFELDGLYAFLAEPFTTEYYELTEYQEKPVFRYMVPLRIEKTCLDCHGSPAGDLDVLGYKKEGLDLGDLAGVRSIIMPAELSIHCANESIIQQVIMMIFTFIGLFFVVSFAIKYIVTSPLKKLEEAVAKIEQGEFDIDISCVGDHDEVQILAEGLQKMAIELNYLYQGLECAVKERTKKLEYANDSLLEKSKQLAQMNELLKKESNYKADFLMTISHDLKTPLTSILAFSEMLLKNSDNVDTKIVLALREIRENGYILMQMVDNILDVSRMDNDKIMLNLETLDIDDLFNTIIKTMMPIAEKRGISFVSDVDSKVPCIEADWEKMRRVIENLLMNAIKFTKGGGCVSLRAFTDEKDNICIEVMDTGIGIKNEDIDKIFDRFIQGDSQSLKNRHSSGIGLYIVKEFVEAHGGTVDVRSKRGYGSTFKIRLPRRGWAR